MEFSNLQQADGCFTSQLTYTYNNLCNYFHKDNDDNSCTYGIWAPISKIGGRLATKHGGFKSIGGEFMIPTYKSYVDFKAWDWVVEIIKRVQIDLYATLQSQTDHRFTRLDTRVQMNKHLV